MDYDVGVLRATEDAVDALARLDEFVASAGPGLGTLLMLRTAQAIVATNDRPIGDEGDAAGPDGDAACAALLGWWYAPESRAFLAGDQVLYGTAVALNTAAEMVRGGRALTLGLVDDALRAAGTALGALPHAFDAVLRASEAGAWPPLLRCGALSSDDCSHTRGIPADLTRAVAPLAGGPTADVYLVPVRADTLASSLHALAERARDAQRRVRLYRERATEGAGQCHTFGRGAPSARALLDLLSRMPALTVGQAARELALSAPATGAAVDRLCDAGWLREITGRGRDRVFVYTPAVALVG